MQGQQTWYDHGILRHHEALAESDIVLPIASLQSRMSKILPSIEDADHKLPNNWMNHVI